MKKFYKVFLAAFIVIALPILIACNDGKVAGNGKEYNVTIAITNLEDTEQVLRVERSENFINSSLNFYTVNFDGSSILYIDSHAHDIENKIKKDENVTITFYTSALSSDIVLKLDENDVVYSDVPDDNYLAFEYSFKITGNTELSLSGYFFMI